MNKWNQNAYGESVPKQEGKFNKEESQIVKEAIERYCQSNKISVIKLCSECDHKSEFKGAWMEIAKCLPKRSIQSIYRHGIRQCHPFKRGAWSDKEVVQLLELVGTIGKKWSVIQTKLERSADSCRDKHREISDEYNKGRWKDDETAQLQKLIREYLQSNHNGSSQATNHVTARVKKAAKDVQNYSIKELGRLIIADDVQIPWSTISKKMNRRSRLSCFKKWQKIMSSNDDDASHHSTNSEENSKRKTTTTKKRTRKESPSNDHDTITKMSRRTRQSTKRQKKKSIEDDSHQKIHEGLLVAISISTTNDDDIIREPTSRLHHESLSIKEHIHQQHEEILYDELQHNNTTNLNLLAESSFQEQVIDASLADSAILQSLSESKPITLEQTQHDTGLWADMSGHRHHHHPELNDNNDETFVDHILSNHHHSEDKYEDAMTMYEESAAAMIAAQTVEAVNLPDTDLLLVPKNVINKENR